MDTNNHRNENLPKTSVNRRTLLKALTGIPVLGFFGYQVNRKLKYQKEKQLEILKELRLDEPNQSETNVSENGQKDLIRVGIIGFGSRAYYLARAMGFMSTKELQQRKTNGTLKDFQQKGSLNAPITGICDVYNMHAEYGMQVAKNRIHDGKGVSKELPVKRYRHYHEMLESSDIDAVVIATPEHHHAQMVIDAVQAGKHIYCEKSFTRSEEELYAAYNAVKNANIVFQLGHQISQNPVFKKAKEIIDKNILGDISLIETTTNRNTADGAWIRHLDKNGKPKPGNKQTIDWNQWLGSRPKVPFSIDRFYNWTKWFDYSRGMLGQLFTHEFDAINQLLAIGIPQTAVASGGIYHWKDNRDIPDVLHATFEYPNKGFTLLYSASLANSRQRGRVIMGRDGSMELGSDVNLMINPDSVQFKDSIKKGIIKPNKNLLSFGPTQSNVDAVTSATEQYYVSRGLTTINVNGQMVDPTHMHIREWLECIRNGTEPTGNIEKSFEEGVAVQMAHKAYIEKRAVKWDAARRRIV